MAQIPPYLLSGLVITITVYAVVVARRRHGSRSTVRRFTARKRPRSSQTSHPHILPETIGRHEIRELLGTGSAATIYKAFDPILRRDVVVKVLHPHLLNTDAARRIRREARALACLRHPAIPTIIEIIYEEPRTLALVEEHVIGEPLNHILDEKGPLSLDEAVTITCIIADALDHAHRNDVIHHDVKPANILITIPSPFQEPVSRKAKEERWGEEGCCAYLLDFGLAAYYDGSSLQALTSQGDLLGTPAYMSPEQIKGERGDARSDVYSLGIVLYEMLTGDCPFQSDTPHGTLMLQVNEEPPDRPLEGLPKSIRAVVQKALRKSPDLRYQSAGELADALERAASIATTGHLAQAGISTSQVIATIQTDRVLVFQGQGAEGPWSPDVYEDTSCVSGEKAHALQFYTFGGGRVVRNGQTAAWRGAMTREVFFYILLHGPLERDAIGVVFWPDLPASKVANNVYYTISQVRRAVGSDVVVAGEGLYQINEDHWLDVDEFERVIEQARLLSSQDCCRAEDLWKRAVALYRGDFLPEVKRVWCVPKREALREMYLKSLAGIGQCREAQGELDEAVNWYRRVLEMDELREDVHRRIMHCYAEADRRSDALAQYRRCQEILERELGLEPSAETEDLHERIATGRQ